MNIVSLLIVGAGGFLGSIARYATVRFMDAKMNSLFPYGTLAVNIAGSLILGLIVGLTFQNPGANPNQRLFFTTGFCGGFTTFSAFALDNINLIEQRSVGAALVYILASVGVSLLAVFAGIAAGRWINS